VSTGVESACPQCGGPLRFAGGHSLVCVCEHCRSTIARVGADLSSLGRMPDLVAIDTRLGLGASGTLGRLHFSALGRVQLEQGQARWQEWYVSWSDGSYGWLAEAQGRVIVSHRFEGSLRLPPLAAWKPGRRVEVSELGELTAQEIGAAVVVSAEGELPYQPQLERGYRFVDATLADGGYVTLDYGTIGDDAEVFVGREFSYAELSLPERVDGTEPPAQGRAFDCPSCGAPLSLKLQDSKTLVCPSCRGLCDLTSGQLQLVAQLAEREQPLLPLDAHGTLDGEALSVIGFCKRACSQADELYRWDEYLLHGEAGYRWLSESQGHWVLLRPLSAASVRVLAPQGRIQIGTRTFAHFQHSSDVRYVDVQGEFYWQIRPDDRAEMDDYVAPPYMASSETTDKELNWTLGQSIAGAELWRAFGLPGEPPEASGVGPCQPNPQQGRARRLGTAAAYACGSLLLAAVSIAAVLPRTPVLSLTVPLSGSSPVSISEPFEIHGATHAAAIRATASNLNQAWVGLDVALINEQTGQSDAVAIELSSYSGYDGGEHWSEGSSVGSAKIGAVPAGRYVLRVEPQIEAGAIRPEAVTLTVTHGVSLWFPLVCAFLLLAGWPAIVLIRAWAFEQRRWQNSDHAGSG
jgi:hypothetical protein